MTDSRETRESSEYGESRSQRTAILLIATAFIAIALGFLMGRVAGDEGTDPSALISVPAKLRRRLSRPRRRLSSPNRRFRRRVRSTHRRGRAQLARPPVIVRPHCRPPAGPLRSR